MSQPCDPPDLQDGEELRPIKGYEGLYSVSNFGRVFGHSHKKWKHIKTNHGLNSVSLSRSPTLTSAMIAWLVAEAFMEEFKEHNTVMCYKDGNKLNCRIDNLKLVPVKYPLRKEELRKKLLAKRRMRVLKNRNEKNEKTEKTEKTDMTDEAFRKYDTLVGGLDIKGKPLRADPDIYAAAAAAMAGLKVTEVDHALRQTGKLCCLSLGFGKEDKKGSLLSIASKKLLQALKRAYHGAVLFSIYF